MDSDFENTCPVVSDTTLSRKFTNDEEVAGGLA